MPQLLNAQLIKLDDRAKVLNDLKKAAAEMNVPVKTSDLVGKDGQVPDLGAMSGPGAVAFTLPKGAISGPINVGRVGVVLSVIDKQEPTAEDIAKNFAQTREQLLSVQHDEIFRIYLGTLAEKYREERRHPLRTQAAGARLLSLRRLDPTASSPGRLLLTPEVEGGSRLHLRSGASQPASYQ